MPLEKASFEQVDFFYDRVLTVLANHILSRFDIMSAPISI